MAMELKFHRENSDLQWGFRLTGGIDVNLPITVIKVAEGSIAENAGMKVGDLLVRVDDNATAGLTHIQVHDLIKEAGNSFVVAVIRGELPEFFTETEQTYDSETTRDGISQSLQINIKANVVDKTEIIVESDEILGQNIKINGSMVTNQPDQSIDITLESDKTTSVQEFNEEIITQLSKTVREETETQEQKVSVAEEIEKNEETDSLASEIQKILQTSENIKQSEVLKVVNEEKISIKQKQQKEDKRWTTFLQKPDRPVPKIKRKELEEPKNTNEQSADRDEHFFITRLLNIVQEPPYRVIIQKQKKKRDEEKEKAKIISSQSSTPISEEVSLQTPEIPSEQDLEKLSVEEQQQEEENVMTEDNEYVLDSEMQDEPFVSEVEMSLEEQLALIQRQLLALTQLPAAIQQTLDAVTQQLSKIVGPVNEPNTEEEKELEEEERRLNSPAETDKTEDKTDALLETLEEVSESGLDTSLQAEQEQISQRSGAQTEDDNKTESELEMLQATPEPDPDENLTPEEREVKRLMEKKQKEAHDLMLELRSRRVKERPTNPLTPLQRPICLPGGRKWHAPDDAHPSPLHKHRNMSDDVIAETISSQSEVLVGTTLGINFLKFQSPPKTLDHLKNSEVFKMIQEMDKPLRGVAARQGKAMAEQDYYSQAQQQTQISG